MSYLTEAEIQEINQDSLNALIRITTQWSGDFSLTFVKCNYDKLQKKIIQQLRNYCPVAVEEMILNPYTENLYSTIIQQLDQKKLAGLIIFGLDNLTQLEAVLQATKYVREEFRNLNFPVILWVNNRTLNQLIRSAHDFYNWGTTIEFFATQNELIQLIQKTGDRIYQQVLDYGAGVFLDNPTLGLETGENGCQELETARQELQERGVNIPLELEASLELILGRGSDHAKQEARHHYQRSLELCEQIDDWVRSALLCYHIGLWWRNRAVLNRTEEIDACKHAATYFQQSIELFEQANRPELAAKFINSLAEVLHYLKHWQQLESVANHAIELHQTDSNSFRLARSYGFLAEVKVAYSQYQEAQQLSQKALQLLQTALSTFKSTTKIAQIQIDCERYYHQGWYLFSLAKTQHKLRKNWEAIATLKQAEKQIKPEYDPQLYIAVLQTLHEIYFKQKEYLKAFDIKQYQRQIEQQFRFRAFVGASRLRSHQIIINPALPSPQQSQLITSEMMAWGREKDINQLMERIRRQDHKLTIIYGESGVGKSSILQAGLVPILKSTRIETHRVIPILQQVYVNWKSELSQYLTTALQEITPLASQKWGELDSKPSTLSNSIIDSPPAPKFGREKTQSPPELGDLGGRNHREINTSIENILNQLKQNSNRGLITVIIFDQFEEFFFECQTSEQRQEFYQLIQSCFELPYIKIIFSLRQDYLYHLLECSRLGYLDNILDKNIIYYIGNFSTTEAQAVIQELTEKVQLNLETDLIDQLVKDLGGNLGEIRPIELQVTGTQLETEQIKTLKQYQDLGDQPKQELVEKFIENTVTDCGKEYQQIPQLILYFLTNENNTRPLKTKTELAEELETQPQKLDLVLEILTGSGLLLQIPAKPEDRYQLVHDYLVSFIRHKYQPLSAELQQERLQRKRWQKRSQWFSVIASYLAVVMIFFALYAERERQRANQQTLISHAKESKALSFSENYWDALITSMETIQLVKKIKQQPINQLSQVTDSLRLALHTDKNHKFREFNRLIGHKNVVVNVAFSPVGDSLPSGIGKIIASASHDGTVRLWSIKGELINTLKGHKAQVENVAFSPDGKMLASASHDETVKLWNTEGKLLHTFKGHRNRVFDVAFSPDGKMLASASHDKTIKLWNTEGKLLHTFEGHQQEVGSVAFSPDGKIIASASNSGTVKLWNTEGKLLNTVQENSEKVYSVTFSHDGQTIASAHEDNTVRLWNIQGELIHTLKGHRSRVYDVTFSPNGQIIASASSDNTIKLWSRNGELIQTLTGHKDWVYGVAFSHDGQTIASASWDHTIKLWNTQGKSLVTTFQGHPRHIYSVAFSPDGQTIASASRDSTVKLWNTQGQLLNTLKGHTWRIHDVTFSPVGDSLPSGIGKIIASASHDGTVRLWSIKGELINTLKGHKAQVENVAFSPDGKMLASASHDETVKLWNTEGKLLHTFKGHRNRVFDVAFSPDGKMLASASHDKTVKLWNIQGELLHTFKGHQQEVNSVAFSPDGKIIISGSNDSTVKLWNTKGKLLKTLTGHLSRVYSVAFSPNGEIMASASRDQTVKLWNKKGELIQTLRGDQHWIYGVAFSPNSQIIASASNDGTISLWNFESWENLVNYGCEQLNDYLITYPQELEELEICQTPSRKKIAASAWVKKGENLAQTGDVKAAVDSFRKALNWDPNLQINPKALAKRLSAPAILKNGKILAREGNIKEAIAAYNKAQKIDPNLIISASDWNSLCWQGSIRQLATQVIFACEKAVKLSPKNGDFLDSRGLAKALIGDTQGAIEDFQAFVDWTDNQEKKVQRQEWIKALRAGENPFTDEVLESNSLQSD